MRRDVISSRSLVEPVQVMSQNGLIRDNVDNEKWWSQKNHPPVNEASSAEVALHFYSHPSADLLEQFDTYSFLD